MNIENMKKDFNKNGYLILKNFFSNDEVRKIRKEIFILLSLLIKKYSIPLDSNMFGVDRFQELFLEDKKFQPSIQSEIYDAMKSLSSFHSLISNPKSLELCREILDTDMCGVASRSYGIRIDNPGDETYKTNWHQDFHVHVRSLKGLVHWIPLVDVDELAGSLHALEGSHKEGPLKIKLLRSSNDKSYSTYSNNLELVGIKDIQSKYKEIRVNCNVGDLVVFDYFLIHSSGFNKSLKSRWTVQIRYFDFRDNYGISKSWPGSVTNDKKIHEVIPEYWERNDDLQNL